MELLFPWLFGLGMVYGAVAVRPGMGVGRFGVVLLVAADEVGVELPDPGAVG